MKQTLRFFKDWKIETFKNDKEEAILISRKFKYKSKEFTAQEIIDLK